MHQTSFKRDRPASPPAGISRCRFLLSVVLVTVGLTGLVQSQEETFPSDWQQLDAKTLTEEANQHWGDLDDATKKAVSVHAWSTFLTDPAFNSETPWETVRMTVSRFGSKNHFDKWLSDGVSQEAYGQMQQRVLDRVDGEPAVVGEGTMLDVREADRLLAEIAIDKQNRPNLFQQWLDQSGWKGWEAEQFVNRTEGYWAGQVPESVRKQLMMYAWETFLTDAGFVEGDPWARVQKMANQFANRHRVSAILDDQISEEERGRLRTRVEDRLDTEEGLINNTPYEEINEKRALLNRLGSTGKRRAKLYADWMAGNNWQGLDLGPQSHLFSILSSRGNAMKQRPLSVRWTGHLTPAQGGDHRFKMVRNRNPDGEPAIDVWVDGQHVIAGDPASTDSYQSDPIRLGAGESVSIKIELNMKGGGYPTAILQWQPPGSRQFRTVPASALTPPEGFQQGTNTGLKGAYYQAVDFQELHMVRLDRQVEMDWDHQPPLSNGYWDQHQALQEELVGKLSDSTFFEQEGVKPGVVRTAVIRTLRMTRRASHRGSVMEGLANSPGFLKATNLMWMKDTVPFCDVSAPGQLADTIGAWCNTNPVREGEVGTYPGWWPPHRKVLSKLYRGYLNVGKQLAGPKPEAGQTLQSEYLRRSDGSCNRNVAKILAGFYRWNQDMEKWHAYLDKVLEEENLVGDARVSWLLARAYSEQVIEGKAPAPLRGEQYYRKAMEVAESRATRFTAIRELAVRLVSLGEQEQAETLIASVEEEYGSEEKQKLFKQWRQRVEKLAEVYQKRIQAQQENSRRRYINSMKQRLEEAKENGRPEKVKRYTELVEQLTDSEGGDN